MTAKPIASLPAILASHRALHDEIARSHPSLARGRVWCARCNAFKDVDVAQCLRTGWPKCHGETMSIDSPQERKTTEKPK